MPAPSTTAVTGRYNVSYQWDTASSADPGIEVHLAAVARHGNAMVTVDDEIGSPDLVEQHRRQIDILVPGPADPPPAIFRVGLGREESSGEIRGGGAAADERR